MSRPQVTVGLTLSGVTTAIDGNIDKKCTHTADTRVRSSFFTERVINIWYSLPSDTVNFSSLGAFKRSLQLVNFDELLRYSLIG